jgi:hypothetical protein
MGRQNKTITFTAQEVSKAALQDLLNAWATEAEIPISIPLFEEDKTGRITEIVQKELAGIPIQTYYEATITVALTTLEADRLDLSSNFTVHPHSAANLSSSFIVLIGRDLHSSFFVPKRWSDLSSSLTVCPIHGIERWLNGGFASGNFSNWYPVPDPTLEPTPHWRILSGGPEAPDWNYAQFRALSSDPVDGSGYPAASGELFYELWPNVPTNCFTESSTFQAMTLWAHDPCIGGGPPQYWQLWIAYTDGTHTTVDFTGDPANLWITHNLAGVIDPNKTIYNLVFQAYVEKRGQSGTDYIYVGIDGCHLIL